MPLPLAALAAISAAPGILRAIKGFSQLNAAKKVKQQDTTPQAVKEDVAMLRNAASTARLPGQDAAETQLAASQSNTLAAATRVGTSPSSVLGALVRSDLNRQRGLLDLAGRSAAYQDGQRRNLQGGLLRLAGYQDRDKQTYNKTVGAYKQAGWTNIAGAASDLATNAVYFGSKAGQEELNGEGGAGGGMPGLPLLRRAPGADADPLLRRRAYNLS